jgi:hypothetical protein
MSAVVAQPEPKLGSAKEIPIVSISQELTPPLDSSPFPLARILRRLPIDMQKRPIREISALARGLDQTRGALGVQSLGDLATEQDRIRRR